MVGHLMLVVDNDFSGNEAADVIIVPATLEHIRELAKNLRAEDEAEILALGISPQKALWRSYKSSISRWAALIDGKVAAVWGVSGAFMGAVGAPWLLTSDEVYKVSAFRFAKIYKKQVKKMLELFPKLENYVDARYDKAIRLLEIIGFEVGEPQEIGKTGAVFRKFERRA